MQGENQAFGRPGLRHWC